MSALLITVGRFRKGGRNEAFEDIRSYIADDLMTQTEENA